MTIPDYQSLLLPVLKCSEPGEVRLNQVVKSLATELELSQEERSKLLPSGQQTIFANRVGWAKTYLKKAGLIEVTRRGYFRITEAGKTVLASHPSQGHYHTPDFFVLRRDGAAWEEWKTEAQLQRLGEKYPTRYQKAEDGTWRCPPGEAQAEPLGLKYQVRTDGDLNPIFSQNLMFLEDYLRFNQQVTPNRPQQVRERVKATPGLTLASLLAGDPDISANDVYGMVVSDQLYVDLKAVPLVQHHQVHLYLCRETYDSCLKPLLPIVWE